MDMNEDGEVVGTNNERKLSRLEELANEADEIRGDEFQETDGDHIIETEHIEAPEVEEVIEAPVVEVKTRKLKINGIEREFTEDQIAAMAAKTASADEYLANAKRLHEEVQARIRPQPSQDVEPDADDLQLARSLQLGDENEAAKVIRKLRNAQPSFNEDVVAARITEKIRLQEDQKWFVEQYSPIVSDPDLLAVAIRREDEMLQSGDNRPTRERYKEIGDSLMSKFLKPANELQAKQDRKASTVRVLPTASARSNTQAAEEPDDSPAAVVAMMAKQRGQR